MNLGKYKRGNNLLDQVLSNKVNFCSHWKNAIKEIQSLIRFKLSWAKKFMTKNKIKILNFYEGY